MRICSGKNFILLIFGYLFVTFGLLPFLSYYRRDTNYDAYNVWEKEIPLNMSLAIHIGQTFKRSKLYQTLWNESYVLYQRHKPYLKPFLDSNFSIKIPKSISQNTSQMFAVLTVIPSQCPNYFYCHPAITSTPIIYHGIFKQKIPHSLLHSKSTTNSSNSLNVSNDDLNDSQADNDKQNSNSDINNQKSQIRDSSASFDDHLKNNKYEPYIYVTTRFDIVERVRPLNVINDQIVKYLGIEFLNFYQDFSYRKSHPNGPFIFYQPLVLYDPFFDIKSERLRLNTTEGHQFSFNVEISFRHYFTWYWKSLFTLSLTQASSLMGPLSETFTRNFNYMKRLFLRSNPILLVTTGVATVFHFIFQILAFESDLRFWSKKKNLVGVSLRTLIIQFVGQLITLLYILDQDLDFITKLIEFGSICLHVWKLLKILRIDSVFPFIHEKDEYKGETDDVDAIGLSYFLIILTPLVIIYAIYQLIYGKFSGVKSYILNILSGAVYSFDFLSLLPQLYVNYKLKTVAGMSRSAFFYKFISTFIDDLYTFLAKLPTLYKIACFRDDIVFVIWLFQCFIYPVDITRPNEYGFVSNEALEEKDKEKQESEKDEDKTDEKDESSDKNNEENVIDKNGENDQKEKVKVE